MISSRRAIVDAETNVLLEMYFRAIGGIVAARLQQDHRAVPSKPENVIDQSGISEALSRQRLLPVRSVRPFWISIGA